MKKSLLTAVTIIILLFCQNLNAQEKWSLEFRPNTNISTNNLADTDLGTGFGFEGSAAYRLMPHLSAYAGWSWNHFKADQPLAGVDATFEETGYTFGMQFIHPIGESNIKYLVRAGGTYNHIEIENNEGDIIEDSGHGLGWQTEGGIVIPVSDNLSLMPSIRYRSLSRDIELGGINKNAKLNYISLGLGLSWSI